MELKFLELKLRNMTVAEYENKFSEVSRFVPYHVDTDEKRTRRFQQGLRPWIKNRVAVLVISSYVTLVQKASIMERGNELYFKDKSGTKRKFQNNGGNPGRKLEGNKSKKLFVKRGDGRFGNRRFDNRDNKNRETKFRPPQAANLIQGRSPLPDCRTCG